MGVANVPLSGDELAVRVAYQYRDHDGYARNLSDGSRFNDKRDDHFVRAHLRYAPEGGNWDVTLSADYNKSHDNGQLTVLTGRTDEHTSELQSLMRISYAVFCLKKIIND